MQKQKIKPFPAPLPLRKLIGPSFILIGLGLGSGEIILWPYLSANFGLGIMWAAVLGISFQFFLNMEIERYALVKGESVFVGFNRMWKGLPYWFMVSSFIGFGWPGMAAASAVLIGSVFGMEANTHFIAIGLLVATGLLFTLGPVLYKMVEAFQKWIIIITVPFVVILTMYLAERADWVVLANGLIGQGAGYGFVPEGIALAVLLSAFAYSGAGGNLNLTQSLYIKDKGYGMGAYAVRIESPITGKTKAAPTAAAHVALAHTAEDYARFKIWWRRVNAEHALVFWLTGGCTMVILALLSYVTVHGETGIAQGIQFILYEAKVIGAQTAPFIGVAFLLSSGIMLLSTQIGVFENCARIVSENIAIRKESRNKPYSISKTFYIALWVFIAFGSAVLLFGFTEPRALIVLGAVINAFTMLVHITLTYFLNRRELPKAYRASWWRQGIIMLEIVFFLVFTGIVLVDKLG